MTSFPKTLDDLNRNDHRMLEVAMTPRSNRRRGVPAKMYKVRDYSIRYAFEDSVRAGTVYSLFGYFRSEPTLITEWLTRLFNFITEDQVPVLTLGFNDRPETVEDAFKAASEHLEAVVAGRIAEIEDEFEGHYDGPEFATYHKGVVVEDGKVVDPWGNGWLWMCRWLIRNLTAYGVFAFYFVVRRAVETSMDVNLGLWADGIQYSDPRQIARKAFEDAAHNLYDDLKVKFEADFNAAAWVDYEADANAGLHP